MLSCGGSGGELWGIVFFYSTETGWTGILLGLILRRVFRFSYTISNVVLDLLLLLLVYVLLILLERELIRLKHSFDALFDLS